MGAPKTGGLRGWDQTRGAYKEVGAPNLGSFGEWELFNIREVDAGFVGPLRSLRSRPEPKRQPPVSAGLGGGGHVFLAVRAG